MPVASTHFPREPFFWVSSLLGGLSYSYVTKLSNVFRESEKAAGGIGINAQFGGVYSAELARPARVSGLAGECSSG